MARIELFDLSCTCLDVEYNGKVKIDVETGDVDLLGLCEDTNLFIYRDGINIISVIDYLKGRALYEAGYTQFIHKDSYYGYWTSSDLFCNYKGRSNSFILKSYAKLFEGDGLYYIAWDFSTREYKIDDDTIIEYDAPSDFWSNCYYCEQCGHYCSYEAWNEDRNMCNDCARNIVIEGYCESHKHNEKPVLFDYTSDTKRVFHTCNDVKDFAGLGFELEIDCDHEREDNNDVARMLCASCGLNDDELRYARDGSLDYGFEIISQPHTLRAFWERSKEWENMLNYLVRKGYTSHDARTCGLHIHVSRVFFGKTKAKQDCAIAKIFSFYEDNWNDLARASRRNNFGYCEKNTYSLYAPTNSKYLKWKKSINGNGSHYVALNNSNRTTFEFRLGRGTLNPLSFFSWIDLTMTIAKNARRLTIQQIESNDIVSWLSGIRESTARYLFKRNAFRPQVIALYPSIAWENNYDDSNED